MPCDCSRNMDRLRRTPGIWESSLELGLRCHVEATKTIDEKDEEATLWLVAGDPADIDRGLVYVANTYEKRVCGFLRRKFPGMSIDDILDGWGDVLLELVVAARAGKLRIDGSIGSWLMTVAKRCAIDRLRRRTSADAVVATVASCLKGTSAGRAWASLNEVDRAEVSDEIERAICVLPEKQRMTMQAFADGFPDTENMEELRREVSRRAGEEVTLASVKRALQEARAKVGPILDRRGFGSAKRGKL